MEQNTFNARVDLSAFAEQVKKIKQEVGKVIVGQEEMIDLLITGIVADGHVLIEGVPGVAKTLTAKLLSKIISVDFHMDYLYHFSECIINNSPYGRRTIKLLFN